MGWQTDSRKYDHFVNRNEGHSLDHERGLKTVLFDITQEPNDVLNADFFKEISSNMFWGSTSPLNMRKGKEVYTKEPTAT